VPRSEEANRRIREEQRAKILEAARMVFARKGPTATMAEVAAAAGVSQGLAYRYFASKNALLRALLEEMVRASVGGAQHILEMPGTPGQRLEFLITRLVEGRREHPELYVPLYQEASGEAPPEDLREMIEQQGQAFIDVLRRLIVDGQATGEIVAGDPDQLVTATFAYLDGLTRMAMYGPKLYGARQQEMHFPGPEIILRIFRPQANQS
jgi:AcrR family transcriptional regulator